MARPEDYHTRNSCFGCSYRLGPFKSPDQEFPYICAYGEPDIPMLDFEEITMDEEALMRCRFRKKYASAWYEARESLAHGTCSKFRIIYSMEYGWFDPVEKHPEQYLLYKEMMTKQLKQKEENNVILAKGPDTEENSEDERGEDEG